VVENLNGVVVDARGGNCFSEVEGYIPGHGTNFCGEMFRCRHCCDLNECVPEVGNGNGDENGNGQRCDRMNGDGWIEVLEIRRLEVRRL